MHVLVALTAPAVKMVLNPLSQQHLVDVICSREVNLQTYLQIQKAVVLCLRALGLPV